MRGRHAESKAARMGWGEKNLQPSREKVVRESCRDAAARQAG